jgi:hypothetical protein
VDKALFDFDEEINNLEQVEDRYPVLNINNDLEHKNSPKVEK